MTETIDTYQHAVDDIEHEILSVKATLWRDLRAIRDRIEASKQAEQQEEQQDAQQAAAAAAATSQSDQTKPPIPNQAAAPTQSPAPVVPQGVAGTPGAQQQWQSQSQSPPLQRNGAPQAPPNRPVAPFPDMGVDLPQPQSKPPSPAAKRKASGAGTPTPAPKPSPQMNGASKPGAKASPANMGSMPTPTLAQIGTPAAPTPAAPTPVPAPVPVSAPTPVTATTAAPFPAADASQVIDLVNLPTTTPGTSALNFTDMGFAVAQGDDAVTSALSQPMSMHIPASSAEVIDIDALFDTAPPPPEPTTQQPPAPTASMTLDSTPGPSDLAQQQPLPAAHDDMYDLGGGTAESMDLDFALDQGGGEETSYIDDLFFGSNDASLVDLDENSLG
ncbi:uncharacterized protein DNG_03310 [Cephalotrichum gorgonifer]|uniref:Uncharacterized protein n=1 Tax=Cephalotrichum gorgonifer TaxID=2041049 RepID=A0AAE8MW64_9PEZI|nr:uncharacterized protein DNG_03310 [Cephalotrichum gorgonifer]